MKVLIPTPLVSYTKTRHVDADGPTLGHLLLDLDRQFPGIRFRMIDEQDNVRAHVRIFVNGDQAFDLARPLAPTDSIAVVQALSGG